MKITKIDINVVEKVGTRLKGYVTIVLDDELAIRNLRVIEGKTSDMFLAMPSKENTRPCASCKASISYRDAYCKKCGAKVTPVIQEAKYRDLCYPVQDTFRKYLEKAVVDEYGKALKKDKEKSV